MRRLTLAALAMALSASAASCTGQGGADGAHEATRPSTPSTAATTTIASTTAPSTTTTPVDLFALRPPPPAGDPTRLAVQISAAERAIRDGGSTEPVLAAAALAQQVAYRQLGAHPEWDAQVLRALPAVLQAAALRNAAARREFASMHTKALPTLPAWHIVRPLPADDLLAWYREGEAAFHIPWPYLAAVHLVETGTGRIRGTSTAGAQGPMQFLPATWATYGAGGDIDDPHDAILGAARYLAANNGATDIDHALYRYNNSVHYVAGVKLYAELIAEHPRAFLGYYHWGIWYLSAQGDVYLPVGYAHDTPISVSDYLGS